LGLLAKGTEAKQDQTGFIIKNKWKKIFYKQTI
jgi:hypothetical protein